MLANHERTTCWTQNLVALINNTGTVEKVLKWNK